MRIDYFAFAYLEYFREQKSTKKLNCIRLFIVEDVSVDIDITCNYGAPELIPSVGMCSIVVAHLKSFFFDLRWVSFGKRNVTSLLLST